MDKNQLLTDKYAPHTLDDVKLQQDRNLDTIIQWANSWLNGLPNPERPSLLLVGSPGIGKTTIARCLCSDCGFHLMELNASDTRSKESLSSFNPQESLMESMTCILLDEMDSLYTKGEEKGGDPTQIIKKLIKSQKFPIILTANNRYKVPKEITSLCEIVQLYRPSANALKAYLYDICKKENIIRSKELIEIASQTQDYRLALNILQYDLILSKSPKNATLSEITRELVLNNQIPINDVKSLLYWLDENCHNLYDPLDLNEIYDILSRVDQLKKRGQIFYANSLLKTIPKTPLDEFELLSPVFKKDDKVEATV